MKVQNLMTTDVQCCKRGDTIENAAKIMVQEDCGAVPVCENDKVVGIVTDRDIVTKIVAKGAWKNATVGDCMTNEVVCCTSDTDAHEAADMMAKHQIRRLPVVDNTGKLIGICAIGDLATVDIHINEAGDALSKISETAIGSNAYH